MGNGIMNQGTGSNNNSTEFPDQNGHEVIQEHQRDTINQVAMRLARIGDEIMREYSERRLEQRRQYEILHDEVRRE